MNKLQLIAFFITIACQTNIHIAQVSDPCANLDPKQKIELLENLGFVFSIPVDNRYIYILTNAIGSTYTVDRNEKLESFATAAPCETTYTHEHSIAKYKNGGQYKTCFSNGDEFVKTPGNNDWQLVPKSIRYLFQSKR